jgi:hypothetical protein
MRSNVLMLCVLVTAAACGGAKLDKSAAQYADVRALAASELDCPDDKVSVRAVGESRVVVNGCDRVTDYVLTCRSPGPRERYYVTNTPAPPTDEAIEALSDTGVAEDQARVMEMRQQQLNYSQGLVAIRLEDLQGGNVEGMTPRHKLDGMPAHWIARECRYMHEE